MDVYFITIRKQPIYLQQEWHLHAFDQPIILLAGGLDRGNGFEDLIPYLHNVKSLIAFGETKEKLLKTGQKAGIEILHAVNNVEEAVPLAYSLSQPGDVILSITSMCKLGSI